ncbi:ATP-binding protein [Sphingobium lignivorans]|uniref:histidine kinase n=1 Tax=Sphingobium lignivorans TaxID=2735886 RepID=A0ABR6NCZ0_9SPHN|nr:ATP-binding protein [Sphingobium lignivorans]MBB5984099.1 signal transduction histidine kinase/CheY-like chemotaxis protein [Sphingobium lignivorans]
MTEDAEGLDDSVDELPRWRRWVPFVLAVVFAIALGCLIYLAGHAADLRDRAIALQRHSYQVMLQAKTVEARIGSAETLLARYVISHDAAVGRQFQDEWGTAMRELVALERSTRGNARQSAAVARLRAAMTDRGSTLTEIALRVRYQQSLGALGQLEATRKEASVRTIADALKTIADLAEAERARHNVQVDQSQSRVNRLNDSYSVIGLGLFLAAIGALWFANAALNERRYARRLAAAEAARVDNLEAAVLQRTEELREANAKLYREMEERIQAEQSLRQLQKMEALGKLTGGIAHDFNNMLAVVVGGIDVARRQMGKDPEKAITHLDSAIEGANHAAALIERLLAFARAEPLLPDQVDIDRLIAGMEDLLARAIGGGVRVELALDAGDWPVWVDRAQLESALVNMAINARDAMDGRGTLTIATERLTLKEQEIGQCTAGDHVCLSVTDTGTGMTPDVLERIFEPFFTTKAIGKGTGLGMSQIFGFVSQCRGAIDIRSAPGEGTCVRLLLPRLAEGQGFGATSPSVGAFAPADAAGPAGGGLTILVVEDDPRVLRSTLAALAALGHASLPCDHPGKAAELLEAHPDIDLILSDVLMPDMSGPEMIETLGAVLAQRPVIFVTGFAGDKGMTAQLAGFPILRKPFTVAQLAQAIADAAASPHDGKAAA